jgi:hypothetical protein
MRHLDFTAADRVLRYGYTDVEVVQRVFGSACYITDSFPR